MSDRNIRIKNTRIAGMKQFLFIILFSFFSLITVAQTEYAGKVRDSISSEPLERVSVVAYDSKNAVTAYCFSDGSGRFRLIVPSGKTISHVVFSMLGYGKQILAAKQMNNNMVVLMSEQMTELRNVTVRSNGMHLRSDTLSYTVNMFRQSTDRSIADVMSHMPGITVTESGIIQYQGKSISKFYIEGLDLMGGKYSMASENIDAMKVKRVEVLQRHQPIKMLRDKQFSDQTALNLVLTEDAKNIWSASMETGAGAALQSSDGDRFLRDIRAIAMLFGRSVQTLTMYKTNNTGQDVQREVRDLANVEYATMPENSWINDIELGSPALNLQRYNFNDSHLIATNILWKSASDKTLRMQASYLFDNTIGHKYSANTYTDIMGAPMVEEDVSVKKITREAKTELQYQYNGSNMFIDNVLRGSANWNTSYCATSLVDNHSQRFVKPRSMSLDDSFRFIRSFNNNRTWKINGSLLLQKMPGMLSLLDNSRQSLDVNVKRLTIGSGFKHETMGFIVNYNASLLMEQQDAECRMAESDEIKVGSYEKYQINIGPLFSYGKNGFNASLNLPLTYQHMGWTGGDDNSLYFSPRFSANYKISSTSDVALSYNYRRMPVSFRYIVPIGFYTSYLSMMQGLGEMTYAKHNNVSLSMKYANPVSGLFFNARTSALFQNGNPMLEASMNGNVYITSPTGRRSNSSQYDFSAELTKAFSLGRFTVSVKTDGMLINHEQLIDKKIMSYQMRNMMTELRLSYIPVSQFAVEGKSQIIFHKNACRGNSSMSTPTITDYEHLLSISYMPGNYHFTWTSELKHNNEDNLPISFFSDIKVGYNSRKYSISLMMTNIFGSNEYDRTYIGTTVIRHNIVTLRPREIIAKLTFGIL